MLLCSLGAFTVTLRPATTDQPGPPPYTLTVSVDEVSLTFHAADFSGIPINDLQQTDLRLLDNGKPPRRIISFHSYQNLPVHAGILMDTSRSMSGDVRRNQTIAGEYIEHLLHKQTDTAFLMRFDSESKVLQSSTNDTDALQTSLRDVAADHNSRLGGTILFDSIYKACRDQFAGPANALGGNFILLFSDGDDNASHTRIEDDIDICQKTNTAIYVFSDKPATFLSDGQKTLRELATKSGGQVFFGQTPESIWNDLSSIDASLRSQYRLIYQPQHFKPDSSFHRIKLDSPTRGGVITTRSGYYAVR
jgi:VWFA-related protein